jgi:uncharacterized paraquat-inducible protein A
MRNKPIRLMQQFQNNMQKCTKCKLSNYAVELNLKDTATSPTCYTKCTKYIISLTGLICVTKHNLFF